MKKLFRVIVFLLSFQMEVRVRASADLLQEPSACLKSKETCAVHVIGPAFHLNSENLRLHASEGSTVMRLANKQWRLIKGSLWVEKAERVQVETAYATMISSSEGQYWILEKGSQIIVRNIDADLRVTLRDGKKLEVPTGFEFWVSGINSRGQSEYGMIHPIDIKEHLPLWNALYVGSKKSFLEEVRQLKESWGDLTEKSAMIYQKSTERKLASVAEEKQQLQTKQQQEHLRREKVKKLFYQRTFER
ncbi:MAG TPA: hypothetical protein VN132_03025 [Bdellovibrio sp.]|nr:hypothetical protein [Bdellovibrio sp.]